MADRCEVPDSLSASNLRFTPNGSKSMRSVSLIFHRVTGYVTSSPMFQSPAGFVDSNESLKSLRTGGHLDFGAIKHDRA